MAEHSVRRRWWLLVLLGDDALLLNEQALLPSWDNALPAARKRILNKG
jgi:hypothetical protein